MQTISIESLMDQSGVGFGTSGARGLVSAMTDQVCFAYTVAFLQYMESAQPGPKVLAIAGDLRPSSPRILQACALAAQHAGWECVHCGFIPSPAIALYGIQQGIPTIMVTGSHIPDDRNGIKFNHRLGEIAKPDESGIKAQSVTIPANLFDSQGMCVQPLAFTAFDEGALQAYRARYVDFFGAQALSGLHIGLYQHSTVGRDVALDILQALGAQVTPLARSEIFIPVDTEAIRPEDHILARDWCAQNSFHALVSMDGDADRPLLATESGEWLRGDVLGILVAQALGIQAVSTPVSCNTAVEKCGSFESVLRTRIGSPFVIEGMQRLASQYRAVAGYEANGGFLLQTPITEGSRTLQALPTRDALLPVIAVLRQCVRTRMAVSALSAALPQRYTASDRLKEFPTLLGQQRVQQMQQTGVAQKVFGPLVGALVAQNTTDGLRMEFATGEIIHLRPSGNAPELRCYTECATPERALELNQQCIGIMEAWRDPASSI